MDNKGFIMPMIIILFGACTLILLSVMQYVVTVANFSNDVIFRQVALSAAKSALDYGKEEFDGRQDFDEIVDPALDDTNSNSIADKLEEKEMFTNSKYRVTYQVTIIENSTSDDGRSKIAKGIGKVYLPSTSTVPRYTRVINGEIVRSQIVAHDPSDFSPLAWYDASCNASIIIKGGHYPNTDPDCQFDTLLKDGTDSAAGNPISMKEETTTGTYCGGEPETASPPSDQMLSMSTGGECGDTAQLVGMIFNLGSKLPKGAAIEQAYIQFGTGAKSMGGIDLKIQGVAADNVPKFTKSGNYQLSGAARTTSFSSWSPPVWASVNQSGIPQRTVNIKDVIQEIIDRPGWTPSTDGTSGNIGIIIERTGGTGARHALNAPITLNITYSGYVGAINDGDSVKVWRDRSGNGHHMMALSESARPTKSSISLSDTSLKLHGRPMVVFSPTASGMKTNVPGSSGRNGNSYTAIAAMRMKNGTEKTYGRGAMVSMYGAGNTNWTTYAPLWRHPDPIHSWDVSSGLNSNHLCNATLHYPSGTTEYNYEKVCVWHDLDNSIRHWGTYSSREGVIERDQTLRINGKNPGYGQSHYFSEIKLQAPYTIALGAHARELNPYSDIEIAEIILYDRSLTCPQIESVEKYLVDKWGMDEAGLPPETIYKSQGCPENNIPAY